MNRRELIRMLSGGVAGIPLVKSIERLSANTEDVIIVKFERPLRPEVRRNIMDSFSLCFPNSKIMIIDHPVEIKIAGRPV